MKQSNAKRKLKRKINATIRALNKNIAKDNLWKGRFYIANKNIQFVGDVDFAVVRLQFIDRQTGTLVNRFWYCYNTYSTDYYLFLAMNHFIINTCKVWEEDPRPDPAMSIDYTKISFKK